MPNCDFDVTVIGAGVVGPAIATALARQGRKVLIVERSWEKPDRIVGELLQPAGLRALKELGMVQAVNNIEALPVKGYYIKFNDRSKALSYDEKSAPHIVNSIHPVPDCVFDGNDKLLNDSTIISKDWDNDSKIRGVAFHHGDFLMNLRSMVKLEQNVTALEGTVTKIIRDDENIVRGVEVKTSGDVKKQYTSKLVISCDGIYSKFRKELSPTNVPDIGSYFVGLELKNAVLPQKSHGHVILGDHAPIVVYQISPTVTRMLCAFRSTKAPSVDDAYNYLKNDVFPALPEVIQPSFTKALEEKKFRPMPNQYLPAMKQGKEKGLILLGDSLNMRHPLTGGGMTVGLNDASLLAKLLHPSIVEDLEDYDLFNKQMKLFNTKRKNLDSVINTLSIALYTLFAADKNSLKILQNGCFEYLLDGECAQIPMGLLSGMLPFPMLLFNHFFSVAFFAIHCNFKERGAVGFLIALFEAFETFAAAVVIFTPYFWHELF